MPRDCLWKGGVIINRLRSENCDDNPCNHRSLRSSSSAIRSGAQVEGICGVRKAQSRPFIVTDESLYIVSQVFDYKVGDMIQHQ